MILHTHKLILTPTRRVAGASVTEALSPYLSSPDDAERFNLGTLSGSEYGALYPQHGNWNDEVTHGPYRDYLKVLLVRNPFDRLLSGYLFLRGSGRYPIPDRGFRDFLAQKDHFRPVDGDIWLWDHTWRTISEMSVLNGELAFDLIIRFESLIPDFERVCRHISLRPPELPHHKRTAHADYQMTYDEDMRALVVEHFHEDFVRFGYSSML